MADRWHCLMAGRRGRPDRQGRPVNRAGDAPEDRHADQV